MSGGADASKPVVMSGPEDCPYRGDRMFEEAVKNVPDRDIDALVAVGCDEPRDTIAMIIATHKWKNRICATCWNSDDPTKLAMCQKCKLEFYCNTECQQSDWKRHKKRCARKDGPADDAPNAIVSMTRNDAL